MTATRWPAVTRDSDPMPSRVGESEITASGKRQSLVAEVAAYVRAHPGQCRGEIAQALHVDEYALSKRLSDAKNMGLIAPGASVRFASRLQSTWQPVIAEPQQIAMSL